MFIGGEGDILKNMLMFLFVYVKDKDFHAEDRNKVNFVSLPKSYKFPLLSSALK